MLDRTYTLLFGLIRVKHMVMSPVGLAVKVLRISVC